MAEAFRDIAVSEREMHLLTDLANTTGVAVVFERVRDKTYTASVLDRDLDGVLKVLDAKEPEFSIK